MSSKFAETLVFFLICVTINAHANEFSRVAPERNTECLVIIRHISKPEHKLFFEMCYAKAKKFYKNIYVVDDSSDNNFLEDTSEMNLIRGEFPKRGEILAYYYFYKNKWADKAVIIHDSVFLNQKIDTDHVKTYQFLWDFRHIWDDDKTTIPWIQKYKEGERLFRFYQKKNSWKGCYGIMSIISWEFLRKMEKETNFFEITLKETKDRAMRMNLERIFACICVYIGGQNDSYFGDIHSYFYKVAGREWDFYFSDYLKNKDRYDFFPAIKVLAGR